MRKFNTLGPVNPRQHYHVNRVAVKAAMRAKIEKGRYFTADEVTDLLGQHTAETGQTFAQATISTIFHETAGQPFLVNRLGQILTQEIEPNRHEALQPAHLNCALALLLRENNTHFASIVSKATPHRSTLLPTLLYDERRSDFLDPETQELLMYGVLREVEEEPHPRVARVANPIYRKLLLRFSPTPHDLQINHLRLHGEKRVHGVQGRTKPGRFRGPGARDSDILA